MSFKEMLINSKKVRVLQNCSLQYLPFFKKCLKFEKCLCTKKCLLHGYSTSYVLKKKIVFPKTVQDFCKMFELNFFLFSTL